MLDSSLRMSELKSKNKVTMKEMSKKRIGVNGPPEKTEKTPESGLAGQMKGESS